MGRRPRLSRAIVGFLRQMAAVARASSSIQSYRREFASVTRGLGDLPLGCLTPDRLNGYLTSRAGKAAFSRQPSAVSFR